MICSGSEEFWEFCKELELVISSLKDVNLVIPKQRSRHLWLCQWRGNLTIRNPTAEFEYLQNIYVKIRKSGFSERKTSSTPNVCSDDKGLPQRQLFPSFISSSPEPNEFYEHSMQMKAEVKIPFPHFVCVWYTYCPNPLQINQSNDHPIRKYLLSVTTTSQYTMGRVLPDSKIPIHWKMLCATFWSGGMTPLSVVVF